MINHEINSHNWQYNFPLCGGNGLPYISNTTLLLSSLLLGLFMNKFTPYEIFFLKNPSFLWTPKRNVSMAGGQVNLNPSIFSIFTQITLLTKEIQHLLTAKSIHYNHLWTEQWFWRHLNRELIAVEIQLKWIRHGPLCGVHSRT